MPKRKIEIEVTGKETASQILAKVDKALAKTGKKTTGLKREFANFSKAFKKNFEQGFGERMGQMAANFVMQIPQMTAELFKLGVQSEAVTQRFNAFAGSTSQAQAYLAAFQTSTDGTVAKMDAMAGASKMLQMDLVSNADEMGVMAAVATKLGNQTMGAGERIADFSALLANRSIPRLDNFGISSSKVRAKVEKLKKAGYDLDQAFKLAVLDEGRKSLETLGDTSELTSTKMAKITAAAQDAKVGVGELLAEMATGGDVDDFTSRLRNLSTTMRQAGAIFKAVAGGGGLAAINNSLKRSAMELANLGEGIDEATNRYKHIAKTVKYYTEESRLNRQESVKLTRVSDGVRESIDRRNKSEQRAIETVIKAAKASRVEAEALEKVRQAANRTKEAMFQMGMSVYDQQKAIAESAEMFAFDREAAEETHLAKMAALRAAGDADGLAAEHAYYDSKMEKMRTMQAEEEEAQRASLGRMLITQFDAWAQMHGIAAEEAMEMRTAIALEYGLMDEKTAATANAMVASWGRWAGGAKKSAAEIVKETDRIIAALGRIPRKVNIAFTTTGGGRLGGPAITAQHGYSGWVGPGYGGSRLFLAGEGSRAEHVSITPGGRGGSGRGDITVIVEGSVMDDRTIERIVRSIDRVSRLRGTGRGG